MKKIIDGKLYDTETAELLGCYRHLYDNNICSYQEDLYRTKKGTYFLTLAGDPYCPYVDSYDISWSTGFNFKLLSDQKAKEWATDRLTADEYIKIYGDSEMG